LLFFGGQAVPKANTATFGAEKAKIPSERAITDDIGIEGGSLVASAALIAAGVLMEPEILGGALLGAGVVYGLPAIGRLLRPVLQTAVAVGYSAAASVSGAVAGAGEEFRSMVAEARSLHDREGSPGASTR
jgi:hypothetical protein